MRGRFDAATTIALVVLVVHLASATGYGIFRDELYYLACADHLAFGYVDHPPLSIGILALVRAIAGDSLWVLRAVPALLHALTVLATAALARRMGAQRFGAALAALCIAVAPGLLGGASFYSMNSLDSILWTLAVLCYVRVLQGGATRAWLALGLCVGLGLLNKYSMAFLAVGMSIGLLFSQRRRALATRGPWLALALAGLLFLPHILWQIAHDWPTREFIANAQRFKIAELSVPDFLLQVFLEMNPATLFVWSVGLAVLLFWRELRDFRALGVAWLVVLAILLQQESKPYYLNVAFPMLFAAGARFWERSVATRWRGLFGAQCALAALSGVVLAPFAMPLLSPPSYVRYAQALGVAPQTSEVHELGPLPQHFADRFGWPEMASAMAEAYRGLTPQEQATCMILGRNYGQTGALLYYGRRLGLPPAVGQHNSFYLWGPGGSEFSVVLSIGQSREDLLTAFDEVTEVGRFDHPYAMPYERDSPIYLCRGWRLPVDAAWRLGRLYI